MAYIFVRFLPNHIPVTTGNPVHYSALEFQIYRSEVPLGEEDKIIGFQEAEGSSGEQIKKGPRIVISARTAPPGSISSEDALCLTSDIPLEGYSFTAPPGWSCSHTYERNAGQVSFLFHAPTEGGSGFTATSIKLNSFFTMAQAGVCALQIRIENFSAYIPDVQDSTFSIPLSKRYHLEILNFTSNGRRGKFFLNHSLPALFQWDVVCDMDTPLELLTDGTFYSALQEFTGEKMMEKRERGDHTYTLKMILPAGEKTESVQIKDTCWRRVEDKGGMEPDLTTQNVLLSWKKTLLVFYTGKVYQTTLTKDYDTLEWRILTSYDGGVQYPSVTAAAVCKGKLYLAGGTKSGSDKMFYSVYDLSSESGKWADYDAGQFAMMTGGVLAGDRGKLTDLWMIYAKRIENFIYLMEYIPEKAIFTATHVLSFEGIKTFAVEIRRGLLYLAVSTEDGILVETWEQGEKDFCEVGKIGESPVWMQWIRGNNKMFLLTDQGLYRENGWDCIEAFYPYSPEEMPLWCGVSNGRIVCLITKEEDVRKYEVWATDIL